MNESDIRQTIQSLLGSPTLYQGRASRQLFANQTGRIALDRPTSQVSAVQARAWGEIRPGQACLVCQDSAGNWHVLPTEEAQLVRRRVVNYKHALPSEKPRPVYPFKILFTKVNANGETEVYLGGDRPPQLLKVLASPLIAGYVANFGPGLDQWSAYIRYYMFDTTATEYFNSSGNVVTNLRVFDDLKYLGQAFWAYPGYYQSEGGIEEQVYSGLLVPPSQRSGEGSYEYVSTESQTVSIQKTTTENILLASNPDLFDEGRQFVYFTQESNVEYTKTIRDNALSFYSAVRLEAVNCYFNNSISPMANQGDSSENTNASGRFGGCGVSSQALDFPHQVPGSEFSTNEALAPVTTVTFSNGDLTFCTEQEMNPPNSSGFQEVKEVNTQLDIQVSPITKLPSLLRYQQNSLAFQVRTNPLRPRSPFILDTLDYVEDSVRPLLAGTESSIYARRHTRRIATGRNAPLTDAPITETVDASLYFNDGKDEQFIKALTTNEFESLSVQSNYNPALTNLIQNKVYIANPSDFRQNGDFQSTVSVESLPGGEATGETGLVFALGDPSEVEIRSMVYWPPSLSP